MSGLGKVAILGVGLIGSSVARAAREKGAAARIALFDSGEGVSDSLRALDLGEVCATLEEAVSGSDLVLVCVPPGRIVEVSRACFPVMESGAILSDTGSVKGEIVRELADIVPEGIFLVPGHPVAGTEFSGAGAGFASLFEDRWCLLTPCGAGGELYTGALERLRWFWERLGARVQLMDSRTHDRVLSLTSHLPHLVAYGLVSSALEVDGGGEEIIRFSGGGFRDFTRIAASDSLMWRDIFLQNSQEVLQHLDIFVERLQDLRTAIELGKGEVLLEAFVEAREVRKRIVNEGEDTVDADFGRSGSFVQNQSSK